MVIVFRCPRDPNIFPALQVERGARDLFADFKAFRFPSTATVNFVATVQFCQDICEPVSKENGLNVWKLVTYCSSLFVFLALQPIVVVFSQPGSGP